MFQAALTVPDIDANSGLGSSISTDDRSSCRFSDGEEVRDLVHNYVILVTEKLTRKASQTLYGRSCMIMSPQALII